MGRLWLSQTDPRGFQLLVIPNLRAEFLGACVLIEFMPPAQHGTVFPNHLRV
jgi:hypothetical protein